MSVFLHCFFFRLENCFSTDLRLNENLSLSFLWFFSISEPKFLGFIGHFLVTQDSRAEDLYLPLTFFPCGAQYLRPRHIFKFTHLQFQIGDIFSHSLLILTLKIFMISHRVEKMIQFSSKFVKFIFGGDAICFCCALQKIIQLISTRKIKIYVNS